ncbi:aldo/keto reductase, partial [Candidatus Bipolaricaulota bacterium]|nr:aldo/keto reductase [Candidatus Bipolaricaulota bacterium]
ARMQKEMEGIIKDELPENVSLPEYALAWSLSHPAVSCVIPGCKTPEHVRMNASVADLPLVDDNHPQATGT